MKRTSRPTLSLPTRVLSPAPRYAAGPEIYHKLRPVAHKPAAALSLRRDSCSQKFSSMPNGWASTLRARAPFFGLRARASRPRSLRTGSRARAPAEVPPRHARNQPRTRANRAVPGRDLLLQFRDRREQVGAPTGRALQGAVPRRAREARHQAGVKRHWRVP